MREKQGLFLSYLRHRRAVLVTAAVYGMIEALVFSLYSLPVEAVLYSTALWAAVMVCAGMVDYLRYRAKHLHLMYLRQTAALGEWREEPAPERLEGDYQQLIVQLIQQCAELTQQRDAALSDRTDYYTLWAHQIKTPITALELLLQTSRFEGRDAMREQVFRIEEYVEMALTFQRLESPSSDLYLAEQPIDPIIQEAVKQYKTFFIIQRLALRYTPINRRVVTDSKWLQFVICQVLSNALKYTPKGSISIYWEDNCLVVADTGIGIRAEDLPRVGEKGFTGYNGRVEQKSTGLGLYLCKRIMKRLGHGFYVTSVISKGTKVYLALEREELKIE